MCILISCFHQKLADLGVQGFHKLHLYFFFWGGGYSAFIGMFTVCPRVPSYMD